MDYRITRYFFILSFFFSPFLHGQKLNENYTERVAFIDSLNDTCKKLWFSNTNLAITAGNQAFEESENIGYGEGLATAYNNLGVAFWVRGEFDRSLEYFYNSINTRDTVGGSLGLGNTYHNIGNIFMDRKNFLESKKWFYKSLDIRKQIYDTLGISYSTNNLGLIAAEEKKYDTALYFLQQSLQMREQLGNIRGIATSKMSLGKLYIELNDKNKAESLYLESLDHWVNIKHLQGQADVLLELAKLSNLKGDFEIASNYAAEGLKVAGNIGAKPQLLNLYLFVAEIELKQGDTLSAFTSLQQAYIYRDSIYNEQKEGLIAQYNQDQVLHANQLLEKENQIQQELLASQKSTNRATFALLLLSIVFILLIYRVLRTRSKANKKLEEKNILIEKQKEEIKNINADLERKIEKRTKTLQESNERLIGYSLFNSHKIRGPLARLLGLVNLFKISQDHELREYIELIDQSAQELDQQVKKATLELTSHIDREEKEE